MPLPMTTLDNGTPFTVVPMHGAPRWQLFHLSYTREEKVIQKLVTKTHTTGTRLTKSKCNSQTLSDVHEKLKMLPTVPPDTVICVMVVRPTKLLPILSDAWTVPTTMDTVDGTQPFPKTTETPTGTIAMPEKILTSHGTSKTSEKNMVSLVLPTMDKPSVTASLIPTAVSSVVQPHLLTVNGSNVVHTTLSKVS